MMVDLTSDEISIALSAIGTVLAFMATGVQAGQPASPEMLAMEALQAKLMKELPDKTDER